MAFKTNIFQTYLANIPHSASKTFSWKQKASSLTKISCVSSKSANSRLHYIVHLKILNWPLSPLRKLSVLNGSHTLNRKPKPTETLSNTLGICPMGRACVCLHKHTKGWEELCAVLNIPQHISGSLEASPIPSSVALLPLPVWAAERQGGGALTAHSGCTPTIVRRKLHFARENTQWSLHI